MKKTRIDEMDNQENFRVYIPNRLARRNIAGMPCGFCGSAMHFREIAALASEEFTAYAHPRCLEVAVTPKQSDVEAGETTTPAADLTKEIVTDEEV